MRVAVKDANIILDLYDIALLDTFLEIDFQFITSDFVKGEIKTPGAMEQLAEMAQSGMIEIISLEYEELNDLFLLKESNRALSITDCSVLYLAEKYDAIMLSGDRSLRNTAKDAGIEYHGILWVLDMLIETEKISHSEAMDKLNLLMSINSRLPVDECRKRLIRWNEK